MNRRGEGMIWSAAQYRRFEHERTRPVHDLIARIPNPHASTAVDLGCGPGNSTELLIERFPEAVVTGIDNSPAMIEAARKRLPGTRFTLGDIAAWSTSTETADVILANAALQWLPDHAALLPALLARLAPGGTLAVQMPDNLNEPAHRHMRAVAAQARWADRLASAARPLEGQHRPEYYYDVLRPAAATVDLWRTTYYHVLPDVSGIAEWFKGSALAPFLLPLDEEERRDFLGAYLDAIGPDHPPRQDGSVLLPFPRLFFVATVAA